jgi:pimeloyl-ACP methyl ester carboxylesterase
MSGLVSKIKGFGVLLFVILAASIAVPGVALAAQGNPSYCDPEIERLTNQNFQDKVPVIMVHGFTGKAQDWGALNNSSSFAGVVNQIPGVAVAHLFSYNSYRWVDNPDSGPKLAKTIDCVSQLSRQNGGKGKVIVVANSMGGLVARDALSHRSSDNQRAVADEVGQVITIGTPHAGTLLPPVGQLIPSEWTPPALLILARAFTPGSPEMERLPHFPQQTIVHTIAGDVTRVYFDRWGREVKREQPFDDTLVSTVSAHLESTIDVNKGGGEKTISCTKNYYALPFFNQYISYQDAPCEHKQLAHNAGNGVRPDTVEAIKKYVASLAEPEGISLTIGPLTTTYDNRWSDVYYGASGPGNDGSAQDTTNGVPCTNCTTTPTPTSYAYIQIAKIPSWCGPVIQCMTGTQMVLAPAPEVAIGGRTPSVSARYQETGGYGSTGLAWCFEEEGICVMYRRGANTPQLEPSSALLDVFSTASWSD